MASSAAAGGTACWSPSTATNRVACRLVVVRQAHPLRACQQGSATEVLRRCNTLSLRFAPCVAAHRPSRSTRPAVQCYAAAPNAQASGLRQLYPAPTLQNSGLLTVSDGHSVYVEVCGNPDGLPALVLHGGPGAGCYPNHARFFDPQHYKIVLMDQRGCGRSQPRACLAHNNTSALVEDIDALRRHLGISQWLIFGGSWGSALSLAYAQAHPEDVLGIILRGVCLMRPQEINWMYGGGAAALKPLAYEAFVEHLAPHERGNPMLGYYKRLLSKDASVRNAAAQAWMRWEMSVSQSNPSDMYVWDGQAWSAQQLQQQPLPAAAPAAGQRALPAGKKGTPPKAQAKLPRGAVVPAEVLAGASDAGNKQGKRSKGRGAPSLQPALAPLDLQPAVAEASSDRSNAWLPGLPLQGANLSDPQVQQLLWQGLNHQGDPSCGSAQALLECHYSIHGAFLLEAPLLDHMERIQHIPAIAVQGQLDFVCPPTTAAALHHAWPSLELRLVPGAGHSMYDLAITDQLVRATDRMRSVRPVSPVAVG